MSSSAPTPRLPGLVCQHARPLKSTWLPVDRDCLNRIRERAGVCTQQRDGSLRAWPVALASVIALAIVAGGLAAALIGTRAVASTASLAFAPLADTYVRSDTPSTSYGSSPRVSVQASGGHTRVAYLRFSITLPAGATVMKASLRLFTVVSATTDGVESAWRREQQLVGGDDLGHQAGSVVDSGQPSHRLRSQQLDRAECDATRQPRRCDERGPVDPRRRQLSGLC